MAKPIEAPPVASDAVFAWTAAYPGQSERVRIEAASLYGKPAWLHVIPAWELTKSAPPLRRSTSIVLAAQLVITIAITIIAIVVTRRSLRRGRSDRQGATRLAFYLGGCLLLSWLIAAHHAVNAEDEARMIASGVGEAAASALVIWIFYMALEPGVRRTWPRSLIGWSRILSGNARDAMVGREILFGIAGGVVAQQVFWLNAVFRERIGTPTRFFLDTNAIDPLRTFIGDQLISHVQMIEIPIGIMFAALLLRKAFGPRGGIAVIALLLSSYAIMSLAVCVFMLLMLFALLRSGLLTTVAMGATASIVDGSLLTLDTASWYWPRSLAVFLIVIGSAVWAARSCSTGSRLRARQVLV